MMVAPAKCQRSLKWTRAGGAWLTDSFGSNGGFLLSSLVLLLMMSQLASSHSSEDWTKTSVTQQPTATSERSLTTASDRSGTGIVALAERDDGDLSTNIMIAGGTLSSKLMSRVTRFYNYFSTVDGSGMTPSVVSYAGVGSSVARDNFFLKNTADIALVDAPLTSSDLATKYTDPDVQMLPVAASAICLVYNLPEASKTITLDRQTTALIFLGDIMWWNDSRILALNPNADIPQQKIRVIVRAESSGTTQVFTQALGSFLPAFSTRIGTKSLPDWCEGRQVSSADKNPTYGEVTCNKAAHSESWTYYRAKGTEGASVSVSLIPYSISYGTYGEAADMKLSISNLVNKAGTTVAPGVDSIVGALIMAEATLDHYWRTPLLIDTDALGGWPIVVLPYIIYQKKTHIGDCTTRKALVQFLHWLLTSKDFGAIASAVGFTSLTEFTRNRIDKEILAQVLCVDAPANTRLTRKTCNSPSSNRCISPGFKAMVIPTVSFRHPEYVSSIVTTYADIIQQVRPFRLEQDSTHISDEATASSLLDLASQGTMAVVFPTELLGKDANYTTVLAAYEDTSIAPFFVTPVKIAFNLGSTITELTLTSETLAQILMGTIENWNDLKLAPLNPYIKLPDLAITVLVDDVKSPVARALANYLSATDKRFDERLGLPLAASKAAIRPLGSLQVVAAGVTATNGSIGFIWGTSDKSLYGASLALNDNKGVVKSDIASLQQCIDSLGDSAILTPSKYVSMFQPIGWASNCWPITKSFNVGIKRVWASGESVVAARYADTFHWLAEATVDVVAMAPLSSRSRVARSVSEIRLGAKSILKPEPLCGLSDMAFNITECLPSRGAMVATFYWLRGPEEKWCLDGLPLPSEVLVECDHMPLDSPVTKMLLALITLFTAICVVVLLLALHFRRTKVITLGQRTFTNMFLFGSILLNLSGLTLFGENTKSSCNLRVWLLSLSFTITFAPLLMKLYRIHRLFNQKRLKRMTISNIVVMMETSAFIAVDLIILGIWSIIASPGSTLVKLYMPSLLSDVTYERCDYGDSTGIYFVIGWKVVILVVGVLLSFRTWNLVEDFSEAKPLAIAIYNTILLGILALVLTSMPSASSYTSIIILSISCSLIATVPVILVMGPKLYYLYKYKEARSSGTSMGVTGTTTSANARNGESTKNEKKSSQQVQPEKVDPATK